MVTSLTSETERDDGLCEWLHSLGIADKEEDSVPTNRSNQRQLLVSRGSRMLGHREGCSDTVAAHRRARHPHVLPPICQPGSLLHVPLLLPENSPPPHPHPAPPQTPPSDPCRYLSSTLCSGGGSEIVSIVTSLWSPGPGCLLVCLLLIYVILGWE